MREILFRGQCVLTGDWQTGSLIIDEKDNHYIGAAIVPKPSATIGITAARRNGKTLNRFVGIGFSMVIPETVGQYTGMSDTNGNKIFEGDILESRISENPEDWKIWEVGFDDGTFTIESVKKSVKSRRKYRHEFIMLCNDEVKFYGLVLIGNIHDNPELMKGGDNE